MSVVRFVPTTSGEGKSLGHTGFARKLGQTQAPGFWLNTWTLAYHEEHGAERWKEHMATYSISFRSTPHIREFKSGPGIDLLADERLVGGI